MAFLSVVKLEDNLFFMESLDFIAAQTSRLNSFDSMIVGQLCHCHYKSKTIWII